MKRHGLREPEKEEGRGGGAHRGGARRPCESLGAVEVARVEEDGGDLREKTRWIRCCASPWLTHVDVEVAADAGGVVGLVRGARGKVVAAVVGDEW